MPFEAQERSARVSPEWQGMFVVLNEMDCLQLRGEVDFEDALTTVNASSVQSVPGAEYVGITLIGPAGEIDTIGPTHPIARTLDDVQREVGEGPCLSAAWEQHTIRIDDLTTDGRWPKYRIAALERTPVRSVLAFRLFNDDRSMAALNFYGNAVGAFDDESVEIGLLFAAHTTVAWNLMRREQQFQSALASRDVIGQAKGILMERFDIDAVAAFELLRRTSQESNQKLVEIAHRLVGGKGRRPD